MQHNNKHERLMEMMRRAGYHVATEGVCFGVAHMAMQAFLAGDIDKFNARIERMMMMSNAEVEKLFQVLDRQSIEGYPASQQSMLSPEEWDILAFLEGLSVYMHPYQHAGVFDEDVMAQNPSRSKMLVTPAKLRAEKFIHKDTGSAASADDASLLEQGVLRKVYGTSRIVGHGEVIGAYDMLALDEYFRQIKANVFHHGMFQQAALVFCSGNHAITVTYHHTKKRWILVDANQLPSVDISDAEIAFRIIHALLSHDNGRAVFSLNVYGLSEHDELLSQSVRRLEKWNDTYIARNLEQVSVTHDMYGASCLFLAARHGNAAFAEKLIAAGATVNERFSTGETPLYVAAAHGHLDTVKLLITHGADASIKNDNGRTPVEVAMQCGHADIAKLLKEKHVNVSSVGKFSQSTDTRPASSSQVTVDADLSTKKNNK